MHSDARLEQIKKIFDEFANQGSTELLMQHVTEDVVYRATVPAGSPLHGDFIGREGIAEYFRRVDALVVIDQVAVTDYFQNGDKVVVLGTERLCTRKTGRAEVCSWATVLTLRGDLIAEVLVIEDHSLLSANDPEAAKPAPG